MTPNTKNTSDNNYHRGKLVMNVDTPERQELVDRLVIHMIKTKKYRTRSDAIYDLIKERLDQIDVEERKKPKVAATAIVNN
jgi:metal-responsive CopG/Arc/MetJ family transcriptional regulator